jgi:hypothetical protein
MNQGKWAKRDAGKRINAETSIGQRMTEARTVASSEDGKPRNAFGDRADGKPVAAPVVEVAPVQTIRINGRVYTDPKLIAAKQASDAAKAQAANAKVRDAQFAAIADDSETSEAVVSMWLIQHPEFIQTDHNITSLQNALTEFLSKTRQAISIPILNDVFSHLFSNNFLESARPLRGQPVARLYPAWEDTDSAQPVAQRRINAQVITAEERQALRNVPLADLAKQVRAGYRKS